MRRHYVMKTSDAVRQALLCTQPMAEQTWVLVQARYHLLAETLHRKMVTLLCHHTNPLLEPLLQKLREEYSITLKKNTLQSSKMYCPDPPGQVPSPARHWPQQQPKPGTFLWKTLPCLWSLSSGDCQCSSTCWNIDFSWPKVCCSALQSAVQG